MIGDISALQARAVDTLRDNFAFLNENLILFTDAFQ